MISSIRSCSFFSRVRGGRITHVRIPTGSAPLEARSLAVICTASVPIPLDAPVIGSVEKTSTSSSAVSMAEQSSPTPGCSNTSGRRCLICLNTALFSTFSGTFPISIIILHSFPRPQTLNCRPSILSSSFSLVS